MGLPLTVVIARDGALLYRSVSFPTNIGDLIAEGNAREPSGTLAIAEETAAEAAESEACLLYTSRCV